MSDPLAPRHAGMVIRHANHLAAASLVGLIVLGTTWELWLAPLRQGGTWLVLKVVPLLLALFGVLRGRRYTHQWASLLSLLYLCEGLVRATSDRGLSHYLAMVEVVLATTLLLGCALFARWTARQQPA